MSVDIFAALRQEMLQKATVKESSSKRARVSPPRNERKEMLARLEKWRKKEPLGEGETLDLSVVEGAECPNKEKTGCEGTVIGTFKIETPHVYLCCTHNDPLHMRTERGTQVCKWSFNQIPDVDPDFALVLLNRREEQLGNERE